MAKERTDYQLLSEEYDYRKQVLELYRNIRQILTNIDLAFLLFQQTRDNLLKNHPSSPLVEVQRKHFSKLRYYDYSPKYKQMRGNFTYHKGDPYIIDQFEKIGTIEFGLPNIHGDKKFYLTVYRICPGGGIIVPFRDRTNGVDTCKHGRILCDTSEGADMGFSKPEYFNVDFNFAFNPNSYYNHKKFPLLPEQIYSQLNIDIFAGEKIISGFENGEFTQEYIESQRKWVLIPVHSETEIFFSCL